MQVMTVQSSRRRAQASAGRAGVRAAILRTAEALLAQRSFATIGVDELMADTGAGRTAFYRYFDDRESVLLALLAGAVDDLRAGVSAWLDEDSTDIEGTLRVGIAAYVRHAPLLRSVADLATSDDRLKEAYLGAVTQFVDAAEQRIRREQERGHAGGLDARRTAEALIWMNERYEYVSFASPSVDPVQLVRTLAAIWGRVLYCNPDDATNPT